MVLCIKHELTYPGTNIVVKKGDVIVLHCPASYVGFASSMRLVKDRRYDNEFCPLVLLVMNIMTSPQNYISAFAIGYDTFYGYECKVNNGGLPVLHYPEGDKSIDIDDYFIDHIFTQLAQSILRRAEYGEFVLYTDFVVIELSHIGSFTFSRSLINILSWPSEAILGWMKAYRPQIRCPAVKALVNVDVRYKFVVEAQKSFSRSIKRPVAESQEGIDESPFITVVKRPYTSQQVLPEALSRSSVLDEIVHPSPEEPYRVDRSVLNTCEGWSKARRMIKGCIPYRLQAINYSAVEHFCKIIQQYLNTQVDHSCVLIMPSPIRNSMDTWLIVVRRKHSLSEHVSPDGIEMSTYRASIQHLFASFIDLGPDALMSEIKHLLEHEVGDEELELIEESAHALMSDIKYLLEHEVGDEELELIEESVHRLSYE